MKKNNTTDNINKSHRLFLILNTAPTSGAINPKLPNILMRRTYISCFPLLLMVYSFNQLYFRYATNPAVTVTPASTERLATPHARAPVTVHPSSRFIKELSIVF